MLRNYKGISVDGFIAIYRMIYNLVFFKGEEKKSVLTHSPDAYYLDSIFPKDEERIKKEFGGKIPENISFYSLKYLYKLDNNTIINFFLYTRKSTFTFYIVKGYNIDQIFSHTERHIDVFINDVIFNDENGIQADKEKDWTVSKHNFVDLLNEAFSYFFPYHDQVEAIIALIIEVIMEGGYEQIDYTLRYLMDTYHNDSFVSIYDDGNRNNKYRKNLNKIITKYAGMNIIQEFLDPGIKANDSKIDSFSDTLIDYLEEIKVARNEYEASKPIPV